MPQDNSQWQEVVGTMIQATFLTIIPGIIQEHKYKQLPQCISCQRRFTENEFADLRRSGHNIVWNIDYAKCPECDGEVQGWKRTS